MGKTNLFLYDEEASLRRNIVALLITTGLVFGASVIIHWLYYLLFSPLTEGLTAIEFKWWYIFNIQFWNWLFIHDSWNWIWLTLVLSFIFCFLSFVVQALQRE